MDTPKAPEKRLMTWPPVSPDTPISKREIRIEMKDLSELIGNITTPDQIAAASNYGAVILNSREDRIKEAALDKYIDEHCEWSRIWAEIMMYRLIGKTSAFFIPGQTLEASVVEELGHSVALWVSCAARGIEAKCAPHVRSDGANPADKLQEYMEIHKMKNGFQEWNRGNINVLRWTIYQLLHDAGGDSRAETFTQPQYVDGPMDIDATPTRSFQGSRYESLRQQPTPEIEKVVNLRDPTLVQRPPHSVIATNQACDASVNSPKEDNDDETQRATRRSARLLNKQTAVYHSLSANVRSDQKAPMVSQTTVNRSAIPRTPSTPRRPSLVLSEGNTRAHPGSPPSLDRRGKDRRARQRRTQALELPIRERVHTTCKQKNDNSGLARLLTRLEDKNKALSAALDKKETAYSSAKKAADTARAEYRKNNNDIMVALRSVANGQGGSASHELQAAIQRLLTIQNETDFPMQPAVDREDEARAALRAAEKERDMFIKKFEGFKCLVVEMLDE